MKLSILFISSLGKKKWGGGEKWTIHTAKGLQDNGHAVRILCRKNSQIQKRAEELGLEVFPISYHTDFSVLGAFALKKYINRFEADVLICGLNRDVRVAGFACKMLSRKPKLISRQGIQLIRNKWKYKETFTKLADGIITNTYSLKKLYDSFGWWGDDFVRVIYNGVTPSKNTDVFNFSELVPMQDDTKVIFSAGRLSKQKGFEYLIESARIAKEAGKDWKYFIAGEGKQRAKLQVLINKYGLQDMFFLMGFIKDITPFLRGCDVFVFPTLYEGMPNVLLEAMLVNTPIVSTPVNGASELVTNQETGLLIETKNPEDAYQKTKFMLENEKEAQAYTAKAKQFVDAEFNIEHSVSKVEAYLFSLTNKSN